MEYGSSSVEPGKTDNGGLSEKVLGKEETGDSSANEGFLEKGIAKLQESVFGKTGGDEEAAAAPANKDENADASIDSLDDEDVEKMIRDKYASTKSQMPDEDDDENDLTVQEGK